MHVARKVSGHYSRIFGFLVLLTPLHLLANSGDMASSAEKYMQALAARRYFSRVVVIKRGPQVLFARAYSEAE